MSKEIKNVCFFLIALIIIKKQFELVMVEPKFNKGDYIINRKGRVMGIVSKLDDKGYYHFKMCYGMVFDRFYDIKTEFLQINYQKFFDFCTDEEKKTVDGLLKRYKEETKNAKKE